MKTCISQHLVQGEKETVRVKGGVLRDTEASAMLHFLFGSPESQRTPSPELPSSFPSPFLL